MGDRVDIGIQEGDEPGCPTCNENYAVVRLDQWGRCFCYLCSEPFLDQDEEVSMSPNENWGPCQGPGCRLYTPRCADSCCTFCCEKIHFEFADASHRLASQSSVGFIVNNPIRDAIERNKGKVVKVSDDSPTELNRPNPPGPTDPPDPPDLAIQTINSRETSVLMSYSGHHGIQEIKEFWEFVGVKGGEILESFEMSKVFGGLDEPAKIST